MKQIICILLLFLLMSCGGTIKRGAEIHDTIYVERTDTVYIGDYETGCGSFVTVCNLPCKTVVVHPENRGKAMMVVWLHGGVHDQKLHDFRSLNHLDCCAADDSIVHYLERKNEKAICLMPLCHKATLNHCVTWRDCADDVTAIIEDYVRNGLVDARRIYLTGSSDGGNGVWDLAELCPSTFAAALALSCGAGRVVSVPIFWHSTRSDGDYSALALQLQQKGCPLEYQYHPDYTHGKDEQICTETFLDRFFAIAK